MQAFDVLVIGGGVSGVAAALASAAAGARTALVRRGPGATALAAGGWLDTPADGLRTALDAVGLPLTACDGALPHPDGHLARCELAPLSHAHAALGSGAERALVCGIAGLPGFHATALARLWSDEARLDGRALDVVELTLPDTPAAGWAPLSLAAAIERAPEMLAAELARAARARGAARVIVPAVLGTAQHARVYDTVQRSAGVRVGEALGTAPSLPGWRLDQALMRAADAAGVTRLAGTVSGRTPRDGALASVDVSTAAGAETITAGAFVLATGRFIGGGITGSDRFEEAALDCDVALERFGRTFDDPGAALVLTDPVRTEPQPVLALGVVTDDRGRPLRASGVACYSNVLAAGAVRATGHAARPGLGTASRDGWDAGTHAATLAGR